MRRSVIGRSLFPLIGGFSVPVLLLLELVIRLHFLLFCYINSSDILCRPFSLIVDSGSGLLSFLSLLFWQPGCCHLNHYLVGGMGGKGRL